MVSHHLVLISAGGTGGHLFPAEALGIVLRSRGLRIALATDRRVGALSTSFPADEVFEIPSATPSGKSLIKMARAGAMLGLGVARAVPIIRRIRPAVAVGFGGYPTVPPLAAARLLRIPTAIHEQNAVMGRANRLLARSASLIATGFPGVRGLPAGAHGRVVHTGNPLRPPVLEAASSDFPPVIEGGTIRILVFGGSQGARVMSDIVPPAIEQLPVELRSRLEITQQARDEDLDRVRSLYARLNVASDVQPFFKDLPARMAGAHLVISRSGASTVAELAAIGRPSILVPLPGALDQDQAANAATLADIGAATVILQQAFTPARLAEELQRRIADPALLTGAAAAAKSAGVTDAAERLADAIIDLAGSPPHGRSS
ncbi:undecaprenyldiphospho-muramoylpentapeptide beta-N-acetylglucosaminyltransferase [Microvirga massiliensis]|uniref:undecaprenyldiphospho-muramoylpentapeptide beta-N-acetylglucosaminyltransferase n=1 Tax=Microvirga massiliensis TaxID=1033741 RepID=UPI00062B90BA